MRKITVATIQMSCTTEVEENVQTAERLVRKAALDKKANVILLPELFERRYFCQERRYDYYGFAKPVSENDAVRHFLTVSKELGVVLPISFYEKDGNVLYNSVAILDPEKGLMGVYRKTHIPDDHFYQEKFYFTPGDTGFRVWDTTYGRIGVGICWDQWFPEAARGMALQGAELLLYPTAIGSEPILETDSSRHWQRVMQGHGAANLMPVAAANRFGREAVKPCEENGFQESELEFYGSSFITEETGDILQSSPRDREDILSAGFDLDELAAKRLEWGIFRDRRPEMYGFLFSKKSV
ncbi:MAG: N-carbamoylputrescine amidase [Lachnospiraceae bacterium]|nr:N-carbamoylputrescine amidase [Lachnospiraceae bacterium]